MSHHHAFGIDIGGTGIKGAIVDVEQGKLVSDRIKLATPLGAEPPDVLNTTAELLQQLNQASPHEDTLPLGVCFPAIVKNGRTLSAANISKSWIGLDAEPLFEKRLGRPITFVNDADAAGIGETQFGAAENVPGVVILTTLGTGIGTALMNDGKLVPNAELGHLEMGGEDAEKLAAYSAMERDNLDWQSWAARLQKYYQTLEFLFSPDLFVVGGGVSKHADEFLPLLKLNTKIVAATHHNNAGIIGAAFLADHKTHLE